MQIKICFTLINIKTKICADTNDKVIDKMHDETKWLPIAEFVRLRSGMYSFVKNDADQYQKVKRISENDDSWGIESRRLIMKMSHEEYKYFLSNKNCLRHEMNMIQNKYLKLGVYRIDTISLSCFNCKKMYT